MNLLVKFFFFFFSSRRRHTRCREVSWARRCVQETVSTQSTWESLIFIDEMITGGHILKDSRTTTAGILELKNGERYFIKRENNKGVKFTLKYMLRRSRVYRAAYVASRLDELGIPTPRVVAVGSRRKFHVLQSGYLITETVDHALLMSKMCQMLNEDKDFFDDFLSTVCAYITNLHDNNIIHGDLKLSNIYCVDEPTGYSFGLWDLDGAVVSNAKLPIHARVSELARVISSYMRISHEQFNIAHDLDALTARFCEQYNALSQVKLPLDKLKRRTVVFLDKHNIPSDNDNSESDENERNTVQSQSSGSQISGKHTTKYLLAAVVGMDTITMKPLPGLL
eukprot:TRINITY_DN7283_c0_g1_i4.p1 TRINITY_DN7283_c0_g1~~TRINITY_DN7283_c0_g1_i4.p1  ORF type:complete len:338 (-),score=63.51 TRINITY_DN7283_c0_g1_i4:204-1217(-)